MSRFSKVRDLLFANQGLRQTLMKNTFWLTVSNLGGRIIRALLLIYVARVLGTAGYGIFSYAVGLAAFFTTFSDIGINAILTKEGVRKPEAMPEYLATALGIKIALLVLLNALVFIATPHFITKIPEVAALLPLVALLITFDGLRDLTFSITRSQERMQTEAGINITTNLAITFIGIAIVLTHPTPFVLMAGYTAGSGIGTIAAYWLLRKHFQSPWRYFRRHLVRPLFLEGISFGVMGLLGTLMLNTDTLMIGWLTKAADAAQTLGLYAAAQRPIQILYVVPAILSTAFFPALSRLALQDGVKFRKLLEHAISFSFMIALPIVVGGVILGNGIVLLLFGQDYSGATPAFIALLLTTVIIFPGMFVTNAVFAKDAQKNFIWYLLLGAIGNVFFDYLLIPVFGLVGSCVATIIAQLLANGLPWLKLKSISQFQTLRHLGRILPATAGMGVAAFLLNLLGLPVLSTIFLAGVIYFFLLYILREPLMAYAHPRLLRGGSVPAATVSD